MDLNANMKSYYRNRDKRLEQKREYYQRNKKKIMDRQKISLKDLSIRKVKELQPKTKKLDEVLEVLRKDKSHYLWSKPVIGWSKKDWKEFNKLEQE